MDSTMADLPLPVPEKRPKNKRATDADSVGAEPDADISHETEVKRARLDSGSDVLLPRNDNDGNLQPSTSTRPDASEDLAGKESVPKGGKKAKDKKEPKKWAGRRRGTRPDKPEGEDVVGEGEDMADKAPRLPKRQCALLIGFCGSGFNGMQIQPNVRTIEGELFKALVAAGAVSQDNADDPVKVGLQRAARTDAGVHSAGNVVSIKMITTVPGIPDLVARINDELPTEIRLWSFQRVQNSFNARMSCDSRKYTYFFPTYLLIPPKPTSGLYRTSRQQSASASTSPVTVDADADVVLHPFWAGADLSASRADDMARKKQWRVGAEQVVALRAAAKRYEGSHNFHNFTVGRDVKDRSCMRHMKKIEVADPVVYGETEWISVMLHGQSFMLHQIRKMMCVLVMAVRTGTPPSIIDALYGSHTVAVPKMPSLGLLLEHPIFESYNTRIAGANERARLTPSDADFRAPVDFAEHAEAIQEFKEAHIYSRMREAEEKVEVFDRWLHTFDRYVGPDLLYYNAQGIIPDAAVVRKGERRANAFKERKRFDATEFAADAPATAFVDDVNGDDDDVVDEEGEGRISKKELEEAEG